MVFCIAFSHRARSRARSVRPAAPLPPGPRRSGAPIRSGEMVRSREVRGLGSNTRRLECYAPPFHKRLGLSNRAPEMGCQISPDASIVPRVQTRTERERIAWTGLRGGSAAAHNAAAKFAGLAQSSGHLSGFAVTALGQPARLGPSLWVWRLRWSSRSRWRTWTAERWRRPSGSALAGVRGRAPLRLASPSLACVEPSCASRDGTWQRDMPLWPALRVGPGLTAPRRRPR